MPSSENSPPRAIPCDGRGPPHGNPADPSWEGRDGRLGYLAKMFPRISETFILKEVLALREHGIGVQIYSLMPPTRDRRMHPEAARLLDEVEVLPEPGRPYFRQFIADYLGALRRRPRATLRETLRVLLRPRQRTFRRLSRAVALAARLRRDRISHLHAAWAHTPASVARISARLTGIPWAMAGHAKDIHLSRRSSLRKKLHAARYTLTCTAANVSLLTDIAGPPQGGTPPPEIALYYHGVNTERFSPAQDAGGGDAGGPALIVSVGRLVPKKGFDFLLQAAAMLRQQGLDFRLEIIGEGELRAALESQARELGISDIVELRGMLVQDDVRAAYARASCMTLASRITARGDRDGIPNTLAEAMACGVPVVATSLASIQELITDEETGLLVPPQDAVALAEALRRLLTDADLRRRLGRAGRQAVVGRFDAATWEARTAARLKRSLAIEKVLYLSADRGVPVCGSKGASVHVRSVVHALRGLGVGVRIVTTRRGPAIGAGVAAPLIQTGIHGKRKERVEKLARRLRGGPPLERALLRLIDNFLVYPETLRQARAWHPDLIYERYALTAVAGSLIARRLKIPHILEVNAPLAAEENRYRDLRLGGLARAAERWILRRADRVVVVSEALARFARQQGVAAERILVLPNAIDPCLFHPKRDGHRVRESLQLGGDFLIGFSGTLKPWHGVAHLLRALAGTRTTAPRLKLLVIGDGPEREPLAGLARELGIADRVTFAGAVRHERVGEYVAACDVLTAPYGPLEDHWFSPLKVGEYLALGRPVIASAIGQVGETLGEAQGVVLVPPGDEQSLAAAITELAEDPARCEALARAAATATAWTWTALARRILSAAEEARQQIWKWDDA